MIIHFHGFHLDLVGLEGVQRADVGGVLHQDHVARVAEDLGGHILGRLRARRDHHVLRQGVEDAFGRHYFADLRAQLLHALASAVLQGGEAILGDDGGRRAGQPLQGQ